MLPAFKCPRKRGRSIPCGTDYFVYNPCTGSYVTARVKDCGPTIRCNATSTGCTGRNKVKFDLTPCAFSKIGNLNDGVKGVDCFGPCA